MARGSCACEESIIIGTPCAFVARRVQGQGCETLIQTDVLDYLRPHEAESEPDEFDFDQMLGLQDLFFCQVAGVPSSSRTPAAICTSRVIGLNNDTILRLPRLPVRLLWPPSEFEPFA